jgi:thiol-disulfide isomerase/thioredoxin
LSSLITKKRFFVSAALCFLLAGCRCDSKESAPAASAASDEEDNEAPDPAEGEESPPEPSAEVPEGVASSAQGSVALEAVSAEALIAKLRTSGRKATLVNAWASFCGPCKREIPMLEKLDATYRSKGIGVVLVTLDEPADVPKAQAFLTERGIHLTSYLAERPLGAFKKGLNPRWPGMLPASFLIDAEGILRYYWGGEAFEGEILPVLDAFLAGKPLEGESTPALDRESAQ